MFTKIFLSLLTSGQLFFSVSLPFDNNQQVLGDFDVQEENISSLPQKVVSPYLDVSLSSGSALLIDEESGTVFYKQNSQEIRSIASLTKLMTVLVFWESKPDLTEKVTVLPKDLKENVTYLNAGDKAFVEDFLKLALVASDNSAASLLARLSGLGDKEFIERMNAKAKELGMKDTFFADVCGLSAKSVSSAQDIYFLFKEVLSNKQLADILSLKEIKVDLGRKLLEISNTNELMSNNYFQIKAGKTGYTFEAGGCLVSLARSLERQVIVVILGSADRFARFQDTKSLLWWFEQNYQ